MFRKKDLVNKTEMPIMPKKRSIERKNYFEGEKSSKANCGKCKLNPFLGTMLIICDTLRDMVQFVQCKIRETH